MNKQIRQMISLLLALVVFCLPAAPSFLADEPQKTENIEVLAQTATEQTYYNYQTQSVGFQPADADLIASFASETQFVQKEGKDCVFLQAGESVTFVFSVEKAAVYLPFVTYMAAETASKDLICSFLLDGTSPFKEAENCTLKRVWKNDGSIEQDSFGNDLIPSMSEQFVWQNAPLLDLTGYESGGYELALSAGEHTLTVIAKEQDLYLAGLVLSPPETPKPYAQMRESWLQEGYADATVGLPKLEAEAPFTQSDTILYPVYDRTSAATSPNDPAKIRRNTIGQAQWADNGMSITYEIEVPEDGLYELTVKFRQNYLLGTAVFRDLSINGEIPCAECKNIRFPFGFGWQNLTISDEQGNAIRVPLKKGKNTVTLSVTLGPWDDVLQGVDRINGEMNDLYRRIIMVTSSDPDPYRDYFLTREISGLSDLCADLSARLAALADEFDRINGEESNQSATLKRASEQLQEFAEKPNDIQDKLSSFREQIAMLSEWLLTNKEQPLEMDYLLFHTNKEEVPRANGNFFENLIFGIRQFFAAFSEEYNSMDSGEADSVLVWVNDGRDQTQILKDLISDRFVPETGIGVRINLVQGGLIEATLAGNGPDVAVGVSRGQPVNLACRGVLADLSKNEGFDAVKNRFRSDALLPYTYQDGVYALPMTQTFLVMFYRTDILQELNLSVPQTWEEMLATAAVLQRKNMTVGLPYTAITAAGAVDLGVGAKDLFPTLLLQYGGKYYNEDLSATALSDQAALDAFNLWTAFYTRYGFDLSYDFNTRFRTGEMPIAIASYAMYGTLEAAAPEIRGQWEMTAMPGTLQEDGSINRAGGASGSAVVVFKGAKNMEACWKLVDFLTTAETQSEYGNEVEALLGPAARYATANLEAFSRLGWTKAQQEVLLEQWDDVQEIEEIPGSYYTSRCIDNAFRAVVYDRETPRTALEREIRNIDRELKRKREELKEKVA